MGDAGMPVALAILVLVFAAAVGFGLFIHRVEVRKGIIVNRDRRLVDTGMSGGLGFLGASSAFLLGVLMLSSLDHFNSTDDIVTAEALSYSAAFQASAGLAATDRAVIQRDLVCLMRSVVTTSWAATESGDATGSENTHAWRSRTAEDVLAIEPKSTVQENSVGAVQSELTETFKAGQQRLLAADSDLPTALWILVYVSIFALVIVITTLLSSYPALAAVTLAAILLLSGSMVWVLTAFSEPFSKDDGVFISPRALNAVMVRLETSYPGAAWAPCPELADS